LTAKTTNCSDSIGGITSELHMQDATNTAEMCRNSFSSKMEYCVMLYCTAAYAKYCLIIKGKCNFHIWSPLYIQSVWLSVLEVYL